MTKSKRGVILIEILSALVFTIAGFTRTASAESTLDKIKRTGVFLAGVRADYPPFGTLDDSGNPIGFGPDLSKIFAEKLGVKVKYVLVNAAVRLPLLLNGGIDADVGLTTPTKQRNEVMDFTTPYVWDSVALLVKKGSSLNLADYGPPKRIASTQSSSVVAYLKEKLPNARIVTFQNPADAAVAELEGKVDAFATDRSAVLAIIKEHPDYVVGKSFALDPTAIGVRQNDSKWLNWLNFTMQELWLTGRYQALFEKWFDEKPQWQIWSAYRLQPGIGQP